MIDIAKMRLHMIQIGLATLTLACKVNGILATRDKLRTFIYTVEVTICNNDVQFHGPATGIRWGLDFFNYQIERGGGLGG